MCPTNFLHFISLPIFPSTPSKFHIATIMGGDFHQPVFIFQGGQPSEAAGGDFVVRVGRCVFQVGCEASQAPPKDSKSLSWMLRDAKTDGSNFEKFWQMNAVEHCPSKLVKRYFLRTKAFLVGGFVGLFFSLRLSTDPYQGRINECKNGATILECFRTCMIVQDVRYRIEEPLFSLPLAWFIFFSSVFLIISQWWALDFCKAHVLKPDVCFIWKNTTQINLSHRKKPFMFVSGFKSGGGVAIKRSTVKVQNDSFIKPFLLCCF